jgi:hypothetical protein
MASGHVNRTQRPICVETRHMRAVLQAQINKTDRGTAD